MGKIFESFSIDGKVLNALVDTGARRSYVVKSSLLPQIHIEQIDHPFHVGLGGQSREIREVALIRGKIEDVSCEMIAYATEELGVDESGKKIDILIGAETLELWAAWIDMDKRKLDLSALRRGEFTEY